jgi:hypothetical protein
MIANQRLTLLIILCSMTEPIMWRSIKEKLESGVLELSHVATENQVADCLIKGLSSIDLIRLCNKMDLMDIFCLS